LLLLGSQRRKLYKSFNTHQGLNVQKKDTPAISRALAPLNVDINLTSPSIHPVIKDQISNSRTKL
jgi:hypothetical protein